MDKYIKRLRFHGWIFQKVNLWSSQKAKVKLLGWANKKVKV